VSTEFSFVISVSFLFLDLVVVIFFGDDGIIGSGGDFFLPREGVARTLVVDGGF
jgi:hypothetical protein